MDRPVQGEICVSDEGVRRKVLLVRTKSMLSFDPKMLLMGA
jgi:hypothetical protein